MLANTVSCGSPSDVVDRYERAVPRHYLDERKSQTVAGIFSKMEMIGNRTVASCQLLVTRENQDLSFLATDN
jgi:hypothetical protein